MVFRSVVTAGTVFSIIGFILALSATLADGIGGIIIRALEGCANIETGKTYGNDVAAAYSAICSLDETSSNCICTQQTSVTSSSVTCFLYDLASGDDCGVMLSTYPQQLDASTALLTIITVTIFVYSIFTCIACCCGASYPPVPFNPVPPPPQQQMMVQMQPQVQQAQYAGFATVAVAPAGQQQAATTQQFQQSPAVAVVVVDHNNSPGGYKL